VKNKPDKSIRIFGADILLTHLASIRKEIDGVRNPQDHDPVHDMRVAIRRFRSTLPLFAACYPQNQTKKWLESTSRLGKTLGQARDADVKIEKLSAVMANLPDKQYATGIHRLMIRLKQLRVRQQEKIIEAVDQIEEKGTLIEIQQFIGDPSSHTEDPIPFSANLYKTACTAIERYRIDLLSYEEFVEQPEKKEELHAMRIAAKRLRYAMEVFAPLYPQGLAGFLKVGRKIQDQLGEIHDYDIWQLFLEEYRIEETRRTEEYYGYTWPIHKHWPGIDYLAAHFQEQRNLYFQEFQKSWQSCKAENCWENLHQVIVTPTSLNREVFPPSPANVQAFPFPEQSSE
jgi:CHAD domain-containing protein